MKTKYALKWITAVLTAVLLTCFGITALAYERIDIDQEASLTLQFNRDSTGFSGVESSCTGWRMCQTAPALFCLVILRHIRFHWIIWTALAGVPWLRLWMLMHQGTGWFQ